MIRDGIYALAQQGLDRLQRHSWKAANRPLRMSDLQRLEHKLEVEHRAWVAETVRLGTVNGILHGRIDELQERVAALEADN